LEIAWLGQSLEELTEMKERLHHQAFHDALTGLPNRVLFSERVAAALDRSRSSGADVGPTVLMLDLDNFKIVNDTWGHAAGDDLLVAVSDRLRLAIRPTDLPARLGGDEFAILLDDASPGEGEAAAERISLLFAEPFRVHDRSVLMRPSVGIATAENTVSAEQLLRNADEAMYEAKADEVRHVAAYEPASHAATRRRGELQFELDDALEHHQIELRFQPVVSLQDGSIQAFESLVRWAHPTYGLMPPGEFLPIADNRQLARIGKLVVREACRHAFLWQDSSGAGRPIGVWINLSAVDLTSESLVEDVGRHISLSKLEPGLVTLEITETSVIVGQDAAIDNVRALRAAGVRIAIDDFGTGYSSLSRLGEFPLDMLKIPMPFVDRISHEQADLRLVDGIIRLADSLGLGVVAEGVERELQAETLRQLGCELAQGYLYSPAIDGETVMRLLRSGLHLPAHGFGTHPSTYRQGEIAKSEAA
jgi:diguanylate cyclase (GGDEF)-like protein